MDEMGEVLGPAPAAVMRVARRYRWQILLKFLPTARPHVRDLLGLGRLCPPSVSMGIDVDPLSIDWLLFTMENSLAYGYLKKVHHIAFNVKDIVVSRSFYGNILGLLNRHNLG